MDGGFQGSGLRSCNHCAMSCPTTGHIRDLASKKSSGIVRHGDRETEIMAVISGYDEGR
jgi:hypothetical protein